jgi:hypothetical protein
MCCFRHQWIRVQISLDRIDLTLWQSREINMVRRASTVNEMVPNAFPQATRASPVVRSCKINLFGFSVWTIAGSCTSDIAESS